jgi:hypothetical protein
LALGILLTGTGLVVVGFGIPINESALGQTLIIAGATALVGGPILIGLGAAVAQLAQIAEGLKGSRPAAAARTGRVAAAVQRADEPAPEPRAPEPRAPEVRLPEPRAPQPRPPQPRPVEARLPDPAPAEPLASEPARAADSTVAVSASAIERLRSTMARPDRPADVEDVPLSPNGGQHPPEPVPEPGPVDAAPEPKAAAVDALKEPRLDFLFRSRPAPPARRESFDAMWPKRGGAAEQPKVEETRPSAEAPAPAEEPRRAAPRPAPQPAAAPPDEQRPSVAILKSGVVDGMAYTLYADGSIEAQLPQGTVRFGSIAELRAHIENNS